MSDLSLQLNRNVFAELPLAAYEGNASWNLDRHIVYVDAEIIALDKPSGMPTHPGLGADDVPSLMQLARNYLGAYVYPVHRLDRATSGIVVMARTQTAATNLASQFADRSVSKVYQAMIRGWINEKIVITRPLARLHDDTLQEATTEVRPLSRFTAHWPVRPFPSSRYSLVELRPKTGRTHQIRRHLSGISHPIIGDTKYGDGAHNIAFREYCDISRLLLHAVRLEFRHPTSGADLQLTSSWSFADTKGCSLPIVTNCSLSARR